MTKHTALPIGVFDSGVGGLTVLRAIRERLPHENFLYMGDTARLPYGTKSQDTIIRYSLQTTAKLVERGVKMLVIACGTASSAALPILRETFAPLPVIGVIEPGAAAAVAASRCKHVMVIATEASIRGKAYEHAMRQCDAQIRVTGRPCTLFVALAEEGWTSGPLVEGIAARYLADLFTGKDTGTLPAPDTLLLGCTHFPPLREALQKVVGPGITLVDSATTTAEAVFQALQRMHIRRAIPQSLEEQTGQCVFLTTDDVERFQRTGSLFFGAPIAREHIELVDL
ncbi:MAG: glutamate racemase [Desulfovibrionaceae bacterium]